MSIISEKERKKQKWKMLRDPLHIVHEKQKQSYKIFNEKSNIRLYTTRSNIFENVGKSDTGL